MKKKHLKRVLASALMGSMVLGLAACGNGGGEKQESGTESGGASGETGKTVLNVINYHVGTDYAADYYAYLFEEFQKTEEGKNVEFKFEEIPTTDAYNQKIKLLISSGDLPDIVFNGGNNITELAAKSGKVADLTPYFEEDPEWKALFDETSLDFNTVDGKIYGVPVSKEISYIYYNKELFEKADVEVPETGYETWDDFFAACDQLKEAGITPVGMDTADMGWLTNLWMSALIGTSGDAGNEWMNTMYPDFSQTEKAPEGFYDKVGIMLMPGRGMEMVPTPGDMVGASDEEKIKAAVAFLKFETSPENQIKALEMTGLQPVSNDLEIPGELTESDPLMAEVLQIQNEAEATYGQNQAYWYQNTIDTFSTELPELAFGNITPEEFCTKLTESAAKNQE